MVWVRKVNGPPFRRVGRPCRDRARGGSRSRITQRAAGLRNRGIPAAEFPGLEGQQVLVRNRCSEQGMNDFATGLLAGGPNVFLDDRRGVARRERSFESWASGRVYENVQIHGSGIRLTNEARAEGAGWTAANSVVWNSEGDKIEARGPRARRISWCAPADRCTRRNWSSGRVHRPGPSEQLAAAGTKSRVSHQSAVATGGKSQRDA